MSEQRSGSQEKAKQYAQELLRRLERGEVPPQSEFIPDVTIHDNPKPYAQPLGTNVSRNDAEAELEEFLKS